MGNDLAPSNVFSDFGSDATKAFSNPVFDVGLGLSALTLGAAAPGLLGLDAATAAAPAALGAAGGSDLATLDALDLGSDPLIGAGVTSTPGAFATLDTPLVASGAGSAFDANVAAADVGSAAAGPGVDVGAAGAGAAPGADAGALPAGWGVTTPNADAFSPFNVGTSGVPYTGGGAGGITGVAESGGIPATQPGFFSSLGTNTVNALKNPLTDIGLAAGGYNLYQGYEAKKAQEAMTAQEMQLANQQAQNAQTIMKQAQPLISSGTLLTSYLTNNTLPPQFQSMVTQWLQGAKASIIQGYSSRGMSSDPKQNSALAQDLTNAQQQADEMKAQLESTLSSAGQQMVQTANQLIGSGISATQLAAEIPIQVSQLNNTLNTQMASVIANFAAALNGGNRQGTVNLTLPNNVITPSGGVNFGG